MDSQELQKLKTRYDIVGNNPALNNALETAVAVAPTDLTVLITGKSGVGKEVLPQIIHSCSRRRRSTIVTALSFMEKSCAISRTDILRVSRPSTMTVPE